MQIADALGLKQFLNALPDEELKNMRVVRSSFDHQFSKIRRVEVDFASELEGNLLDYEEAKGKPTMVLVLG